MKTSKLINRVLISAVALMTSAFTHATALTLPAKNELSVGVYNSFDVYSLDLLKLCSADPRCQPSGPLPVDAGPGQIADQAIILTAANGNNVDNFPSPFTAGASVDDSFETPTGASQPPSYTMVDPAGEFTGDLANRWDISISLLSNNFLKGNDLVFLFDNNQQGSFDGQNLAIWGQARIVDANGNLIDNLCFEISSLTGGCADTSSNPNPTTSDYLPVIGDFCVDKVTGISYAPDGSGSDSCPVNSNHPSGGYDVTNNLSTCCAEFAAFNQILDNAVKNPAYANYFLSVNVKYIGNLAGAEQLWLCSECDITQKVPEPGSMALVGLGLLGLAGLRRRKFKRV